MRKFSRTLTFESNFERGTRLVTRNQEQMSSHSRGNMEERSRSVTGDEKTRNIKYEHHMRQPLNAQVPSDYANRPGLSGSFIPIENDFSVSIVGKQLHNKNVNLFGNGFKTGNYDHDSIDRYQDELHWTHERKEQVKRVRFVICFLSLIGLAFGLMSRLLLNVSIVEMVKRPNIVPGEELVVSNKLKTTPLTTISPLLDVDLNNIQQPTDAPENISIDPLIYAATDDSVGVETATLRPESNSNYEDDRSMSLFDDQDQKNLKKNSTFADNIEQNRDSGDRLHFNWSKQDVNILLGSFYLGYGPGILFSGSLAQKYGAKWPLFTCVFGSALINIFTPLIAQTSLNLLIASRILLGLVQGSLIPCLYELFNRWLTQTESSIFAPLLKVSMPLGSLIGTLMPGILASFKLDWPNLFYIGGFLCLSWSLAWLFLATSLPQDNRFVGAMELNRIMRKKKQFQQATITDKSNVQNKGESTLSTGSKSNGTPWLPIITNPSVLALTVVKFTYNIGMDFIFLQIAVYLREVHNAPIETISAIASGGYCMQMMLIAFVGWLAKVVVLNRAFGLSVTKWRKIFQGGANSLMALTYFVLAYSKPDLNIAALMLLLVCFFWMLGAGGESLVPYDLSSEHPASIVGLAHAVSIFSGITLTAVCDIVLGENTENPANWSILFYFLSATLALGGLVFVVIVKAKPFLPGEKVPKLSTMILK